MAIPQLTTCCCGCSLKTGTKIIGWFSLVAAALMLVTSAFGLASLYYMEDHPTDQNKSILDHLPALKTLTVFLIVVHVIACALSFMLLMGAYQNKAKLVFYWVMIALTTALMEMALNLIEAMVFGQPGKLINILFFLVDLYFILVVYSFYREIRNMSDYA